MDIVWGAGSHDAYTADGYATNQATLQPMNPILNILLISTLIYTSIGSFYDYQSIAMRVRLNSALKSLFYIKREVDEKKQAACLQDLPNTIISCSDHKVSVLVELGNGNQVTITLYREFQKKRWQCLASNSEQYIPYACRQKSKEL